MARPRPGSAAAGAGGVGAKESLENALAVFGLNTGSGIRDFDDGPAWLVTRGDGDHAPGWGVLDRVVDEIDDQLHQPRLVADDRRIAAIACHQLNVACAGQRLHRIRHPGGNLGQVEPVGRQRLLASFGARQHEQLTDQSAELSHVLAHAPQCLLILVRRARPFEGDVDLTHQHRQRGTQLVRGIGGELALLLERFFEAIQHAVECGGQARQLVASSQAQTLAQVFGADLCRGARDGVDWVERPASQEQAAGNREQQDQRDSEGHLGE